MPRTVALAEETPPTIFGFKLASVNSNLTGATVTGPAGSPAAVSVDLGATNPNNGDTITSSLGSCPCTITLGAGELLIADNVTITGPGAPTFASGTALLTVTVTTPESVSVPSVIW